MTDSRQILICMCHTQHDMGLYYSNLSSEGRVFERTNCSVHNHHAACEFDGFCVLGCADRKARPFHSVDIFVGIDCRFTCNFTAVCSGSSSSTTFSSIGIHQLFINGLLSRRTSLPCTSTRRGQFYISAHRADSPCLHWLDVCL